MPENRLTDTLARFVSETRFGDLPDPVVRECHRLLLDTVGCALGGVRTESGEIALSYADRLGGTPAATVIGRRHRSSATSAAYANARLANVLDADDTFPTSAHFGNATVFGALALAEELDRTGAELLTAIAVGFDLGARVGSWMGAPFQIADGQVIGWNELGGPPASVTWAAVGACAGIAGLDLEQTRHAFGIGGANCPQPSIRKWAASGRQPMYKYADAGWCAEVGVNAAMLAGMGSTGFAGILDGEDGFWKLYGSPTHDDAVLLDGLGVEWQILNTTYKPWPCCRWIHHPLTALTRLTREHSIDPASIEQIVVRANPFALGPIFCEQQPPDPLSAEFSHPHALAAAALGIAPGPQWYEPETLDRPDLRALRAKVTVAPEPRSSNIAEWMGGGQWRGIPGGVDVVAGGRRYSATADHALGDPWTSETLLSDEALMEKFAVMSGVDRERSARAAQLLRGIEDVDSVRGLMDAFADALNEP